MKKYLQPDGKITFCRVEKKWLSSITKKEKKGTKKKTKVRGKDLLGCN